MEEYIKILLEQIRFEKAHKAIGDEIRAHIEDQAEANISEGMDKATAEKKALEDMGDPVETGIALDKVHRPQLAWEFVVATLAVTVFSIILHIFMTKQLNWGLAFQISKGHIVQEGTMFVFYSLVGVAVMLLLYLMDFTTIAKYSKIAGIILLISYFASLYWVWMPNPDSVDYEIARLFNDLNSRVDSLMFLMIPIYAGILYKYRGQKYGGLVKAVMWILICTFLLSFYDGKYGFETMAITMVCMLAQLTIAIKKEWIKVRKAPAIIFIWSLLVLPIISVIKTFSLYDFWYEEITIRPIIRSAKLFGRGQVSGDSIDCVEDINILTYISTTMGIGIAIAVIAAILGLIIYGLIVTAKTKNQLGLVMGIGCMMWLIEKVIFNMTFGFGLFFDYSSASFLPFISGGLRFDGLLASYAMFGIILSIYKYKNAYAEHVDISLRARSKDMGV
ncbi:permease prefix domain 1-containing protein [Butyrivibrio sp. AE2005]|uniref:permease prefix domain 1-containing protein n=1 Tax=Butyrivibrio sp. AE2005 TaxID=1496722 RepID=UPI00047A4446|nr:permease prefix domain 1-containing protein [Butyrivibrio sp. AE2005]